MTLRTSIRLPIVASAVAAVLVIAPTASASSDPGFVLRRSAPTVNDPHGTQARYAAQKVMPQSANPFAHSGGTITSSVPSVPDRVDGLGSARGPQVVQVPLSATNDDGLTWSEGAIGAAFLLAALILVAYTIKTTASRRRGGQPLPS